VDALKYRLGTLIGGATIEAVRDRVEPGNAMDLLLGADVVLDGLDNMESRYLVNEACIELEVPWVYGGVVATGGLVAPFPPGGPCLRCLFLDPPEPGALPTTSQVGIHPSLPAVIASVQVALASRFVLEGVTKPALVAMDLWSDDWRVIALTRRKDCPVCVQGLRDHVELRAEW
jgi:adenylyltransferase/sulfurtransferase